LLPVPGRFQVLSRFQVRGRFRVRVAGGVPVPLSVRLWLGVPGGLTRHGGVGIRGAGKRGADH
jgi:hypothetical protein